MMRRERLVVLRDEAILSFYAICIIFQRIICAKLPIDFSRNLWYTNNVKRGVVNRNHQMSTTEKVVVKPKKI